MAHDHIHPAHHAHGAVVDVNPPGAEHGAHHGHTIVPLRVLVLTLATLLFFTLATVGAALLEKYIAHTFAVEIPQWINVAVALSIAAVKTTIVAMFFMQLRYDSPVNSLVLFFTIVTVALFLGFTMIDLGNRSTIYDYKGEYKVVGGTGGYIRKSQFLQPAEKDKPRTYYRTVPPGMSYALDVRNETMEVLHNTLVNGQELTANLAEFHTHMLHDFERLHELHEPIPAHIQQHVNFIREFAKTLRAANKPLPPAIADFAEVLEEKHGTVPAPEFRSSPSRGRVIKGLSPEFAPAHEEGQHAPGAPSDHKTEPAKDKPAHAPAH